MTIVSTGWTVGLVLGVVVILIAAAIVITIVGSRSGSPTQAPDRGRAASTWCAQQTDALHDIARINDSGVRILHSARALRKVAVGK